jgi:signal transduction histidine kinase
VREVLGAIVEQLGAITEHTGASILLVRDDAFEFVQARSVTGVRAEAGARIPFDVAPVLSTSMRQGETILIADVQSDEPLAADYRAAIDSLGVGDQPPFDVIRSWLAVPLVHKSRVLGILTMSWTEPSYFTDDHARLARAFADQAAISIENARLFDETRKRARELGALLDTSNALASTLELHHLLELILDQLRAFVDYAGASLNLLQDGVLHQLAVRRPRGPAVTEQDRKLVIPRNVYEGLGFRIGAKDLLLIDDVHGDSPEAQAYREMYGGSIKGTSVEYIHSFINLPLVARGEVVGVLSLAHEEPGYLRVEHAELLRPLADQAAVAIENARLYAETQRSARRFEVLSRADSELFSSLDLDTVLRALVDVTVDVLGADKSMVSTWDGETRVMSLRAWRNLGESTLDYIRALFNERIQHLEGRNARQGRYDDSLAGVIVTEDPSRAAPHLVPIIEAEGIGSMIETPIFSADGRPVGFFSVAYTSEHHFQDDEQRLLTALAERAAVAIENAEIYRKAQLAASLEERQRLARELHDSVSQALYGIALGARTARTQLDRDPEKAAEPIEYVLSLAEAGLAEMRALIFELRPESLESEGLVAALGKQVAATGARHGLLIRTEFCEEPDAPVQAKEALYRIAQEALHNVVKHAKAENASITLRQSANSLTLSIRDDGTGYDPGAEYSGHLGLKSMRERAEASGGSLRIESAPGRGSTVEACIPTALSQH